MGFEKAFSFSIIFPEIEHLDVPILEPRDNAGRSEWERGGLEGCGVFGVDPEAGLESGGIHEIDRVVITEDHQFGVGDPGEVVNAFEIGDIVRVDRGNKLDLEGVVLELLLESQEFEVSLDVAEDDVVWVDRGFGNGGDADLVVEGEHFVVGG